MGIVLGNGAYAAAQEHKLAWLKNMWLGCGAAACRQTEHRDMQQAESINGLH